MIPRVSALMLVAVASTVLASEENLQIARMRGIALEMKALYDPLKDFQCLDGSMKLPFSYVNDDYCDCPDGSDEPGTAACARGKFHCVNLMHTPLDIPSSRVNDGICDCCDGSDEYDSTVSCPNTCDELGRAAREEAKRREELFSQGGQLRRAMVDQGKLKVSEAKQKVSELKSRVEEAKQERDQRDEARKEAENLERKMLDMEAEQRKDQEPSTLKEEAEKAETNAYIEEDKRNARDTFEELDTNEDGIVTYQEIMERKQFDQDKNGEVTQEEAKFFLAYLEEVDSEEFISTAWPLIKPVWLLHKHQEKQQATEAPYDDSLPSPPAASEKEDELLDELEDFDQSVDENESDDDPSPPEFPPSDKDAAKDESIEHEQQPRDPVVKEAVDAADKARSEYHEAERRYKDIEQELEKYEQILNGDFGEESEFASLRGECFELIEKEYIYKLCPFDRCSQRSKDGGSETALGRWARWEQRDGNRYATMKFEGGTGCWNGPSRSTVVIMQCGLSNQLTSASEPSRCEYQFEFSTPAACTIGMPTASGTHQPDAGQADQAGADSDHDEL